MMQNKQLIKTLLISSLVSSHILASTTITTTQLMSALVNDAITPHFYTEQKNSEYLKSHISKFDKNPNLSLSFNTGWIPELTKRQDVTPDFSQNNYINANLLYSMNSIKDINLGLGASVSTTDWYNDAIAKAFVGYQYNNVNILGAYGYEHRFDNNHSNSYSDSTSYGLAISWLKIVSSYVYNDYQKLTSTQTVKSQKNLSLSYVLNNHFSVFVNDKRIAYVYSNEDKNAEDKSVGFSYQINPRFSIGAAHHITNANSFSSSQDREHASFNASFTF